MFLHLNFDFSLDDLLSQSDIPYAIEEGSIIEGIGSTAPDGSMFKKLYDTSIRTGLCTPNKDRIKSGEFAETCMLIESLGILSADYTETAKCSLFIAQEYYLSVSLAIAVPVRIPSNCTFSQRCSSCGITAA